MPGSTPPETSQTGAFPRRAPGRPALPYEYDTTTTSSGAGGGAARLPRRTGGTATKGSPMIEAPGAYALWSPFEGRTSPATIRQIDRKTAS